MSLPNNHHQDDVEINSTNNIEAMDLILLESSDLMQLAETLQGCSSSSVKSVDVSCPNHQRGAQLPWNSDEIRYLFETIGRLPHLKRIHFKFLGGGDHDNMIPLSLFTALLLSSSSSPSSSPTSTTNNLESFRLVLVGPINCTPQDTEQFAQALQTQRNLREFRLSCCYFSHDVLNNTTASSNPVDSMLQALSTLPLLETVNLKAASKGHLGRIHAPSIHTLLCPPPSSTTTTTTTKSIKTLCFDNFALDNSHMQCISCALQSNKSILEDLYLNLSCPGTSGSLLDPNALPDALQSNQSLRRLQLRLSQQKTLENFLLNTARALRHNKTLKMLGFHGGIPMNSEIEAAFAQALEESNCTVESLALPSSNYTGELRQTIDFLLQLNGRGRQRLLQECQSITPQEWIQLFTNTANDLSFVYYYMRTVSPLL